MKLTFAYYLVAFITFSSCTSTKPSATEVKTVKMNKEKALIGEGYSKAKVINRGRDCGYLFELIDGGSLLNPVSWSNSENYKKDGHVVWLKYRVSRAPQNGCLDAKPIVIDEVQLIE